MFGQVERMEKELLTKIFYEFEVEDRRVRGRICTRWLGGVKEARNEKSQELRDATMKRMDKRHWSDFMKGTRCVVGSSRISIIWS